jgi:hypothetical protein
MGLVSSTGSGESARVDTTSGSNTKVSAPTSVVPKLLPFEKGMYDG